MTVERLAILGIGSVRCAPPVLASLGTYFGERELELRLFDADPERLDLFVRFARLCAIVGDTHHRVVACDAWSEGIDGPTGAPARADAAILCVGENCARRMLGTWRKVEPSPDSDTVLAPYRGRARERVLAPLTTGTRDEVIVEACLPMLKALRGVAILSLVREVNLGFEAWDWPAVPEDREAIPHQILRWIRVDEPVRPYLDAHDRSPLKAWLEAPSKS